MNFNYLVETSRGKKGRKLLLLPEKLRKEPEEK